MKTLTRRDFLKLSSLLGLSLSLPAALAACDLDDSEADVGKVLIVGAGAAGMTAGYLLAQSGVDFQILEASSSYGGRMKRTRSFADFPIPLGAEWLHAPPTEFEAIVNDPDVDVRVQTAAYSTQDRFGYYEDGELFFESFEDSDRKFINSTWFDFFDTYIVPSVRSKMVFNIEIVGVDYSDERVRLRDNNEQIYVADKVIVTVPLKILQDELIDFVPALPADKQEAIGEAVIWSGLKVFVEFSEKFYPTFLGFPDSYTDGGQRLFYDAAYGQETEANVLGLFSVGEQAEAYQALSDEAMLNRILAELDEIFAGAASRTYVKHLVQNWNAEPYARAAYLEDDAPSYISRELAKSVDDKLFFAGDAYTQEDDWSAVHNAARSARDAVEEILGLDSWL